MATALVRIQVRQRNLRARNSLVSAVRQSLFVLCLCVLNIDQISIEPRSTYTYNLTS